MCLDYFFVKFVLRVLDYCRIRLELWREMFDRAKERGAFGIAIFGRWNCYSPIGIGVVSRFCFMLFLSMEGRSSWVMIQDIGCVEGFLVM